MPGSQIAVYSKFAEYRESWDQLGIYRIVVLSDLHAQIQDAFNEYGVQIMSPHFERQPEGKIFVSKSHWHAAPAGGSRTNGPVQN